MAPGIRENFGTKAITMRSTSCAALLLFSLTGCQAFPIRPLGLADTAPTPESEFTMARYYEQEGKYDQAQAAYQQILAHDANHAAARHRLGVLAVRQGNLEEGMRQLQQARPLQPNDPELLCDLGYTLYLQGRTQDAAAVLGEVLERNPKHQRAANNLGLVLGQQGNLAESLAMFRRVNADAAAHANLAYVHSQRGELDKAEQQYSRALDYDDELRTAAEGLLQVAERRKTARESASVASSSPAPEVSAKLASLEVVEDLQEIPERQAKADVAALATRLKTALREQEAARSQADTASDVQEADTPKASNQFGSTSIRKIRVLDDAPAPARDAVRRAITRPARRPGRWPETLYSGVLPPPSSGARRPSCKADATKTPSQPAAASLPTSSRSRTPPPAINSMSPDSRLSRPNSGIVEGP
jgi:tetratricopeptide (TPR) repeat protein